ncbi:heme exporter protein C [Salmonella enterica subsp. arizonae]|nr:heme exporter protein C [Salmonella enterica subsp. arizonae]
MQQSIDPAMRTPLRLAITGYLLLFYHRFPLMRMRKPDFNHGKTPPVGERTDTEKGGASEYGICIVE